MEETRKRRRLSESGSFQVEDAVKEAIKNDTVAAEQHNEQQTASSSAAASRQPRKTLFVRSLPASATTESLTEYFSQSYVIKHATVVLDPETKQSKGYGFVSFADLEDAQRALEEFNGSDFDGKKIKVDYAEPRHREVDETVGKSHPTAEALRLKEERERRRAETQPPRLIVRNLPWSIKEPDDLAVLFRSYGKVKHVVLPKKGNQLAGFGFVVLRGKKNAEKALEGVNGKEVDGRTIAVDWAVEKEAWENAQKSAEDDADAKPEADGEEDATPAQDEEHQWEDVGSGSEAEDSEEEDEDVDMEDVEDEDEEEEEQEDERNASTVFIRNLPFTSTDELLYEHFTRFGPVRYARIVLDYETERPKGTGFVCFYKVEDAISCVRNAPKQTEVLAEKDKSKPQTIVKHSVLQNENADPTGQYTMDGRVLQVTRAVSKTQASRLQEEGVNKRLTRDTDKRRLYLLSEGTIPSNSALYKKLSPSEVKMREDSLKQRQTLIKNNPTLHLSLTRLSIRNIPRHITSKDLKALAREAVVGFAKDVKAGLRQPLSKEELKRSSEEMREAEQERKLKGKGIVKQAKIVFEGRDGSKIEEKSGAGRSRGYGFIEYATHRNALMGLRWLNGHAVDMKPENGVKEKKKRLIVEFAIENAQVVKRRSEHQAKVRTSDKTDKADDDSRSDDKRGRKGFQKRDQRGAQRGDRGDRRGDQRGGQRGDRGDRRDRRDQKGPPGKPSQDFKQGLKRKRSESSSNDKKPGDKENSRNGGEKDNGVAKRNRIIAKKRMQRKTRKGKA
ncbi:ribosome biogenesis (Nop4), putative [Paecilomyces variotii No. 5]|uniref:Ribosome biogenesis (Nop4), putative n=1 Tax=Byssochlamys spectabilis (strain No. 5 / NBRC 109023) TaxID=1356009 RepID=V5FDU2_BYSSN|nr:ribosome biogenesis (Nop4), putative [Paecilomyces variotii No. 5]